MVAKRRSRSGETRFKLATARWFYAIMGRLAQVDLEPDAGDFRLVDRAPLDALLRLRERSRFLRGMSSWVGFSRAVVEYDRDARTAGETKYPLRKMLRFALDGLTSFSNFPLQLAALAGFACAALALLGLPLTIVARYSGIYERGVPSLLFAVLLIGGIQLLALGMLGEYLGRIYDEVKQRPLYVVSRSQNLDPRGGRGGRARRRRAARPRGAAAIPVRVAVIGAGVAGLVCAHRLTEAGHACDVYERWPGLGGQAATIDVGGGHLLERYYHHLFTSDRHIAELYEELGMPDELEWRPSSMAFFLEGALVAVHDAAAPAALRAALAALARPHGARGPEAAEDARATSRRSSA